METKRIIKGLLTFIPGSGRFLMRRGTGGTNTAEYCYEVWLKHITLLWETGFRQLPHTVAELGPGDSLGMGLSAMLSGADRYYALDIVKYSNTELNLKIFDELVEMFRSRAGRPSKGWPDYDPYLNKNLFPDHILTDEVLKSALDEKRVGRIRQTLNDPGTEVDGVLIKYMVPWSDDSVIERGTVDMIFSHSVLEHVMDLQNTYKALHLWLKPGGIMSHQIDLSSHGYSEKWNGFRSYSDLLWKIIEGKRPYRLNQQPYSKHISILEDNGFEILCALNHLSNNGLSRDELSSRWKHISDKDLMTSGAFIQSKTNSPTGYSDPL